MTTLSGATPTGAAPLSTRAGSAFLGIDCGGTDVKLLLAGEVEDRLVEIRSAIVPTPRGPHAYVQLRSLIAAFLDGREVLGLALSVPGVVDHTGLITACSNVAWLQGTRPVAELSDIGDVVVLNDGVSAAVAEGELGAGRGFRDLFVYALGTGIAGAHVLDGSIRSGAHGGAYEIGHIGCGTGALCSCGQRGCLETFIGGTVLGARWDEARGAGHGSKAREVTAAARAGDPIALGILDEASTALAHSLVGVVTMLDPEAIVIGGGLTASADLLVDPAVAKARSLATFQVMPPVLIAELGVWAGAWGAALAARSASATPAGR